MSKIIFRERIYIPIEAIDVAKVKGAFTHHMFDEATCSRCEFKPERPCGECEECPGFQGTFNLWKQVENAQGEFIGIPMGSQRRVRKLFPHLENYDVDDQRSSRPFTHDIEFTGRLYDYQKLAARAMTDAKYGLLESPPRSGKTVMVTAMICKFGMKTIILASQRDWLNGFYETICGSETQPALTNVPDIEGQYRKVICGFPKKLEEFSTFDISLVTYQTFLSPGGRKLLKAVRSKFGVLFLDESDKSGGTEFAKIISEFNCRHRYGVTGTVDRKDGREFLTKAILGPVQYKVELEGLKPRIAFTLTKFKKQYKTWNPLIAALAKDEERNNLIVDLVKKYYKEGHSIVIPVWRKEQVANLVDLINKRAGKQIATAFTGIVKDKDRKSGIIDMRNRQLRVIVGIRSILSRGINIPTLSCLIVAAPISNPPNFKQETSRVLTPLPGKIQPVIHHLLDDAGGLALGCFRNCVLNTYVANKWHITKEDWAVITPYIKVTKRKLYDDDIGDTPAVGAKRSTFAAFAAGRKR